MSAAAYAERGDAILTRLPAGVTHGVEVGVFLGQLSRYLLENLPGLHLTLVDPWARAEPGSRYHASGEWHGTLTHWQQESFYRETLGRTDEFSARRTVLRMPSVQAATRVPDGSQDFVFIDGEHTYEAVCEDIAAWKPKVRPGGLLCGHDYANYQFPFGYTVEQAVHEAADANGWTVDVGENFTWFCRVD